ncbi:MAG TPA: hypothetical protein PKA16_08350 [Ottowia sp.]|uniref:hypothetical protein n=1 Tax=Ottowia sp. TaxID=1898956 RepID=UPI002CCE8EED|nr:hypothetical protein [Ottowia sp.]HMN21391.1 hypothetical protein [Ottowia sp.]
MATELRAAGVNFTLPRYGATGMHTPGFYDAVAPILMADPLAALLGATEGGRIEYHYLDAVKLVGHSCPTVASAWLMTGRTLAHLYPDGLPERGNVRVELRQAANAGVAGVIASIAGLVTGAAAASGFKGLAGRYERRDLLRFGIPMPGEIRYARLDTDTAVTLAHQPQAVPQPPGLTEQLHAALAPGAGATTRADFAQSWQQWVRDMLLDHAGDSALFAVFNGG